MRNISQTVHEVFGIALRMGLLDVNILVGDEKLKVWFLYSYKPYSRDCYSFTVHRISTFSSENYTKQLEVPFSDLFPSKSFKFHNCPLYIATFSMEPFVILRNNSFGNGIIYDGLDVKIVNEISKSFGLNPKYVQAPDKKQRGIISKNRTATGAIKMVRNY